MQLPRTTLITAALALTVCVPMAAKATSFSGREIQQFQPQTSPPISSATLPDDPTGQTAAVQQLLAFKPSDVKFNLETLMDLLRDHRHEGWVLSAYPDPKTRLPLIGAGFSLDLPARDHLQQDTLNPHQFLEPSSAELWQAAGLDPEVLKEILIRFNTAPVAPVRRRSHKRRKPPTPEITNEEATKLLRIAIVQAIYNARAYSRDFDSFSASQQMAMTQLVYQMGVNLEGFSRFLGVINDDSAAVLTFGPGVFDANHWDDVQAALVQSQWARTYRSRAISVIAMLDPHYVTNPGGAELSVASALPPAIVPMHESRPALELRTASYRKRTTRQHRKQAGRMRKAI